MLDERPNMKQEPGPAFPPPPPPPDCGEALAVWGHTKGAWWGAKLKTLLVMFVLWAVVVRGEITRFSIVLTACTLLPTWLLILYGSPARAISIGPDWLRYASRRWDYWVRTDDLVKVK